MAKRSGRMTGISLYLVYFDDVTFRDMDMDPSSKKNQRVSEVTKLVEAKISWKLTLW